MRRVGPLTGLTANGVIYSADGTAYADVNPGAGTPGSTPGAKLATILLEELTHLVEHAGLVPSADDSDLQQVRKAMESLVAARSIAVVAKTAAYTVTAADRGKLIDATANTWPLGLTAAATLGAGWWICVRNSGTGTITIDPNAAEVIDGAATITLGAGESFLVVCTGAAFKTIGRVVLSTTAPAMNGVAAAGASREAARGDHVHPTDTSRLPVADPNYTGTATGPLINATGANNGTASYQQLANLRVRGNGTEWTEVGPNNNTGYLALSGGSNHLNSSAGGQIRLTGETHPTYPSAIQFYLGTTAMGGCTATYFNMPTVYSATSAAAANVVVAASGNLFRSTSSLIYKWAVEDLESARADDFVTRARPVWYRSRCAADPQDWGYYGLIAEEVADIDPRLVHWGRPHKVIETAPAFPGKPSVMGTDADGSEIEIEPAIPPHDAEYAVVEDMDQPLRPEGVQYDRITVMLLDVVRRQGKQIADLTARVTALEGVA